MDHMPIRPLSFKSFSDVRDMTSSTYASNISMKIFCKCQDEQVHDWKLALVQNRSERGDQKKVLEAREACRGSKTSRFPAEIWESDGEKEELLDK